MPESSQDLAAAGCTAIPKSSNSQRAVSDIPLSLQQYLMTICGQENESYICKPPLQIAFGP